MKYYLGVLLTTAIVTYLIRALPLTIFRKEIKSRFLRDFFHYIPYAVLGAMTFPAILYSTRSIISAAAGFIVACLAAYFKRGLLQTALLAAAAVYITELILTMTGGM
ncbi:MAG: AzlD domain-containing protein [Clostridia bacterium]|nr:AzlD domain-containing protein [Clostridia bacterium]